MSGNSDINASLMIENRLYERFEIFFQEKPQTLLAREREEQSSGIVALQEPNTQVVGHSSLWVGDESSNGLGTAQNSPSRMVESVSDITNPLRSPLSRRYAPHATGR